MAELMLKRCLDSPFIAYGDISMNQVVKIVTGTDPVKVDVAGAGDGIGVAMNDAAEGEVVNVMLLGIHPVARGSEAITAGEKIISAANGQTAQSDTGNILGTALGTPSATGEFYPALINPSINSESA